MREYDLNFILSSQILCKFFSALPAGRDKALLATVLLGMVLDSGAHQLRSRQGW